MRRCSTKVVWLVPLALGLLHCTAVTAKTGYQCESTADCKGRDGEFANSVCKDGLCQSIVARPPPSRVCASHFDCTFETGGFARCIDGRCAKYPCDVRGDVSSDDGILLGVLRPSTLGSVGLDISQSLPTLVGALLDQWNTNLGTLAASGEGRSLPPRAGALICDEGDIDAAVRNFQEFRVKAIIGPMTEPALLALRNKVRSEIPILSPTGDSPAFSETAGADQPWFCSSNLAEAAEPFAALIGKVAEAAAAERGHPSKVALVHNGWSDGEKRFIEKTKPELEKLSPPLSVPLSEFDINADLTKKGTSIPVTSTGIAQAKPDIVVMSGAVWARRFITDLEARWNVISSTTTKPVYVVMRTLPNLDDVLKSEGWPRKVYALDVARDGAAMQSSFAAIQTLLAAEDNGTGARAPFAAGAYNDCLLAGLYGIFKAQTASASSASSLVADEISQGIAVAGGSGGGQITLTTLVPDMSTGVGLLGTPLSQTQMTGANGVYGFAATTHVPVAKLAPYCLSDQIGGGGDPWRRFDITGGQSVPSTCH